MKTPNKTPTDKPTKPQPWTPPRGIRYETNGNRPSAPFMLRWQGEDRPRSQSFATEAEREQTAKALAEKREDHGREVLNFDPLEWRQWLAFKAATGGVDPFVIVGEWKAARAALGLTGTHAVAVGDAVEKYLSFRLAGSLSPDTVRHFTKHLRDRFAAEHSSVRLPDLTSDMIQLWLDRLNHPRTGEPMDSITKRHHRKDVNTFLVWCLGKGWLARNPCAGVAVPAVAEEDVELLTVEEGRKLFAANAGRPVIYRIALEAFGFLRASSAGRLRKDDVKFTERGIRMPGSAHKSGKTRFRQGHPDNLWAWLNSAPDAAWEMTPIQYRNEKRIAFGIARIGESENRLRKTCLSAHLAWLKNQPLTSYLAQHRHQSTTDIYLGAMDETEAAKWFQIGPDFIPTA